MENPRCDLILLSWNSLEFTRPCVESLLAHTAPPCRLIIVDQNSNRETQEYLRSVQSTPSVRVELIVNPKNLGFSEGMNVGLRQAAAPYACFLNNDILLPPGWLEEMIAVLESDPSIGSVCPASNTFDIHPAPGGDWLALARSRAGLSGRWMELPYGEAFCMLARTNLLRRLGGFDGQTYEQIYFEDNDLGRRVQAEGLSCVMAEGTYVWHHGGRSTRHHPERDLLFRKNRERYEARWGPEGPKTLYVLTCLDPETCGRAAVSARAEANRSGLAWILVPAGNTGQAWPRHINIRIEQHRGLAFAWRITRRILFKKKGFEVICCDAGWLRRVLRFIHRAEVRPI